MICSVHIFLFIESSFIKFYGDKIIDLQRSAKQGEKSINARTVKIREDPNRGIVLSGVMSKCITKIPEILDVVAASNSSLERYCRESNIHPSDVHLVFSLELRTLNDEGLTFPSFVCFDRLFTYIPFISLLYLFLSLFLSPHPQAMSFFNSHARSI